MTLILGIESSCDETAAAILEDGKKILSNVVASQVDVHKKYGGVVPELASRHHLENIVPVVRGAFAEARVSPYQLEGIAVTQGPGLVGSLLVGINYAKALSFGLGIPLIGVNHIEGHIFSAPLTLWEEESQKKDAITDWNTLLPCLSLVVSGGHTSLFWIKSWGVNSQGKECYELLGRTRDDAAGEAFDKAARMMGLGYPGGPVIQKIAEIGGPSEPLPRAWIPGTWDFSFSGLKTAVLHRARAEGIYPAPEGGPNAEAVAALARSFQDAVADVIATKTARAADEFGVQGIVIGGGVAANSALREALNDRSSVPVISPPPVFCTDNGAMIAAAAFHYLKRGDRSGLDLDVTPGLTIDEAPSAPTPTRV